MKPWCHTGCDDVAQWMLARHAHNVEHYGSLKIPVPRPAARSADQRAARSRGREDGEDCTVEMGRHESGDDAHDPARKGALHQFIEELSEARLHGTLPKLIRRSQKLGLHRQAHSMGGLDLTVSGRERKRLR